MLSLKVKSALQVIYNALPVKEVNWAIAGRASLILQDIDVDTNEINILTSRNGAYEIERRLRQFAVKHVQFTEDIKTCSHFGMLIINNTPSEIIGEFRLRASDGKWESPFKVLENRHFIEFDGLEIPVTTLEYEVKVMRAVGDEATTSLVEEFLSRKTAV